MNPGRACFRCNDPNHLSHQCPQRNNPGQPQPAQPAQQPGPRGRAFLLTAAQAQNDNDVINGTFLINGIYASVLFDTGADRSFVSAEFEKLLMCNRTKLPKSFTVEVANGKSITVDSVLQDCKLILNDHSFPIDLIPMQLGSFDIIVGMD